MAPSQPQLLDRLDLAVVLDKLVGDHQPHFRVGRDARELDECVERRVELARPLHALCVLEKMFARVGEKAFCGADLAEFEIGRMPVGLIAQDLVAERDGVVIEAGGDVAIRSQVVVHDRLAHVADPAMEVSDPVVHPEIGLPARLLVGLHGELVVIDRALPVLALLALSRLLPEFRAFSHLATYGRVGGVRLQPVQTYIA